MCKVDSQWEHAIKRKELSSVLCDDLEGWTRGSRRDVQEGEDVCIYIADSLHCTEDTNTTLQSNYNLIFLKTKKKKI